MFDSMTRSHFQVCTINGIPIGLNASWLGVFGLVVWTLATGYFPQVAVALPSTVLWAVSVLAALLFFASILGHELGHAITAQLCGIPVRSITLFALGGVSRIASEPRNAREELLIAIAGPAVSVALAIGFWAASFLAPFSSLWTSITAYLVLVNGALAVFNMLPALPLDGGRVMRAILWKMSGDPWRATRWSAWAGRFCGLSLASLGVVTGLFGGIMFAFWAVLIGLFIDRSARSSFAAALEGDDGLRGVMKPAGAGAGVGAGLNPLSPALSFAKAEVIYVDADEREHRELSERVVEWRARLDALPRPGQIAEENTGLGGAAALPEGYMDDRMEMFRLLNDVDVKIRSRLSRAEIEADFAQLGTLFDRWAAAEQDAEQDAEHDADEDTEVTEPGRIDDPPGSRADA